MYEVTPVQGGEWLHDAPSGHATEGYGIVLPGTPPTSNVRERMHWASLRREDETWFNDTVTLMGQVQRRIRPGEGDPPWDRVDIECLFRFATPNRRDVPNLLGGMKPAIDALHQGVKNRLGLGLFPDDSYLYLHQVTGAVQRTLVARPEVRLRVYRCHHEGAE